jgi:mono/diheme cytochrome c family protein
MAGTMTIDNEKPESVEEEPKSFFARGVLLGLIGGALVAVMLISVAGSVGSLFDELFGSSTAAADEPVEVDPVVLAGEALASGNGCSACHSVDGTVLAGPSWLGLGDRADEDYIRTSIIDPNAVIVEGFVAGIMPTTYADSISDDDLDALVAYLASL